MTTFEIVFTGRQVGSIGRTQLYRVEVIAADESAAHLKLYDKYEHITNAKVITQYAGAASQLEHKGELS